MSPASSNTDATATPANELDNLSAILEFRVKHAWRVNNQGKHEEAEEMAAKLLMEPALSIVHQGWMHLLLAGSPHDYVLHISEAVRLFTQVLDENKPTATPHELDCMTKTREKAKDAQRQALSDKRAAYRKAAEALAAGKTMTDLHEDKMKELQKFEDGQSAEAQAFAQGSDLPGGVSGSGIGGGGGHEVSQEATCPASSQSVHETAARTSQGSTRGRSHPVAIEVEEYDMGDGTAPLPLIYSSDEDMT
ncbi:hypothetical protein CGCA056_v011743 [Colletotrichum aenigma]|uniref:uncharacterized protein n=1 Tax=Colletotrichum aenigma TaxID=1215731 RepID=UPI00187275CB|nr:uncharacterized protein CGCA056_v011743 [Colletotrichum aenigma]KAF5512684.1 hypothetical protein CGCA056_v011743 [Colletotrichum aenigma]